MIAIEIKQGKNTSSQSLSQQRLIIAQLQQKNKALDEKINNNVSLLVSKKVSRKDS